jgi:threonine/homoserine/homoserine lactone efflux protein
MNFHRLVLYLVAVFFAMIAPGPDMLFVLASGMRGGPRAGLPARRWTIRADPERGHIPAR